jgi:molybdate transport system substrate-binding protein
MLLLFCNVSFAEEFQIATAGHFLLPLQELLRMFEKETGNKAVITATSMGILYAKLKEGAPFDLFLSGDTLTPIKIEQEGLGIANTRFSYAIGKLVLWSPNPNLVDKKGEVLKKGNFTHLALAHPERAPYGVAAKQLLQQWELWQSLQDKLLITEDPIPAYKKIIAGEAELGLLPLSILNPSKKIEGSLWIVPSGLYGRLEHQAILLNHGENNEAAKAFFAFLKSARAKNVIESFGYSLPK